MRWGPRGSSQTTAKLRHVAERVVGGTESLEVAYHPFSSAARFPPPPSLASLPLASSASCSLQRFNAIPCKFVCGQVYMVPGLSVSSIYPRSSVPPPVCRLPPAAPLQFTTIISLGRPSPPWVNIAKSVSTHKRLYLCTCVFITVCTHKCVYAVSKKPRTCRCP